jgi:N,N'-diacetyllegionaminate synthase
MRAVSVGDRLLGPGAPCFIAAEIGLNHNGDPELAHQLIDAAADAGVDGVKFQNYRTEDFLHDRSLTYEYVSAGNTVVESQYEMFKRYELPDDVWPALREHCDRRGVIFFSTPTSEVGVTQLVKLGVPLIKNGSDYLQNLPLIRTMAQTGIPTVLSTGMATFAEIESAVLAFRQAGGTDLILLHCTSSYPTPSEDVHLRKIPALELAFDCPIGFSDHTFGVVAALGAVALGGCFIEKHFTLDRSLRGPDHRFSADPNELRQLVESVRILETSLGDSEFRLAQSELFGRSEFRLSCVLRHDLRAGHMLEEADVAFRRPGTGLPPASLNAILGHQLVHDVAADVPLQLSDFQ